MVFLVDFYSILKYAKTTPSICSTITPNLIKLNLIFIINDLALKSQDCHSKIA